MSHIVREEFRWETADGRTLTIDEIPDEHLANIVMHVKKYKDYYPDVFYILSFLRIECELRGLGSNFIDGAPHKYTDKNGVLQGGADTTIIKHGLAMQPVNIWEILEEMGKELE